MIKIRVVAKILFLTLWMLTACSSGAVAPLETKSTTPTRDADLISTPIPEVTPTSAVSQLAVQVEDLQGVTIEFWYPWNFERAAAMLALVEQFNRENSWGINVSAQNYGSNLGQHIYEGIPSDVLPNLTVGYSSQLRDWERRGDRIVDLNIYLDDPVWGFSPAEQADFYSAFWDDGLVEAKRLGLPASRSAMVLFYNQSWAADLGFSAPPTTPAEFKTQACAAAAVNQDGTGGWMARLDAITALTWLDAFGSDFYDQAGYHFANQQSADALAFLKDLFANGCAWLPEITNNPQQAFAARQGLLLSSSLAGLEAQAAAFDQSSRSDDWRVLPFPAIDGQPVLRSYGLSYVIFQGTPAEQLAAWLFIRWLQQPENQTTWLSADQSFATRAATAALLRDPLPQWRQAQALIGYSRSEPDSGSWSVARWAVQDAFAQLPYAGFSQENIPDLLSELDATLADIQAQNW